jgi:cysteine desulfurase / selenocysteine lyase
MIKDVRFEKTTYQHAPEKFEAGTPDIAGRRRPGRGD